VTVAEGIKMNAKHKSESDKALWHIPFLEGRYPSWQIETNADKMEKGTKPIDYVCILGISILLYHTSFTFQSNLAAVKQEGLDLEIGKEP
jgi:hypothetical protein